MAIISTIQGAVPGIKAENIRLTDGMQHTAPQR